jgi:hypothetical protein
MRRETFTNCALTRYLGEQQKAAEFTEHKGALFKRTQKGNFSETPYCPTCNRPLSMLPINNMVACTKCGYHPGFRSNEIARLVRELNQLEA